MSSTPRWILGIIALLFGLTFVPTVIENPGNILMWLVMIFMLLIAVACLIPQYRNLSLRFIGGAVFGGYSAYLISSIGQEDLPRAIQGSIVFGLPGLYFAVFGKYPNWANFAKVFDSK